MANFTDTQYLNLTLSTAEPDVLGFTQVSRFYGPGAWAAWFLAICASWYSLTPWGSKTALGLLIWLLPLNASAIDHLRHIHTLRRLKGSSDLSWSEELASVGAAYTVTWWGLCHAFVQAYAVVKEPPEARNNGSRLRFLIFGSIIPAISVGMVVLVSDEEIVRSAPILYWKGMLAANGDGLTSWFPHDEAYWNSAYFGIWVFLYDIAIVVAVAYVIVKNRFKKAGYTFYPEHWLRCIKIGNIGTGLTRLFITMLCICFIRTVVWLGSRGGVPGWLFTTMNLLHHFYLALVFVFLPIFALVWFPILSLQYTYAAYLKNWSIHQESCFFMPCAPHSIGEPGQLMGLIMGLVSVTIVEVLLPYIRRKSEARQVFETDTAAKLDLDEISNRESTGLLSMDSPAASDEIDGPSSTKRRVDSGLRVEEGRAESQGTFETRM